MKHGPRSVGLRSCGTQTKLLHGKWNLPGPGIEPMFPSLAGGFSSGCDYFGKNVKSDGSEPC